MTIIFATLQRPSNSKHVYSVWMTLRYTSLLLTVCGILITARHLLAQTVTPVTGSDIEALVREFDQPGMPGCAFGIAHTGGPTLSHYYGLADVENAVPITADTRFDIGSMSKQFLGMAVLMLSSRNQLNLDADVHDYVPELPAYPWKVTLRNLLHHTSGLKDYDQLLQLAGWRDGDLKSIHDVLWIVTRQKALGFEPGTRYMYSDTNYFLLGLIAQRVSGVPIDNLLRDLVFRPLGMEHTSLHTDRWSLIPHKASPYEIRDGKPRLFVNAEEPLGDGGVFTTVNDLALWERNFETADVGGPQVIAEMQQIVPLRDGAPNDYAVGLYRRTFYGIPMLEHSGTSYGYQADKLRFPNQRLSIIVLCNRRDGSYVELSNRLASAFLGVKPKNDSAAFATLPRKDLERFAGVYFSESAADGVLIEVRESALLDAGADREYRSTGPLRFTASSAGTLCRCSVTYKFRLDAAGRVSGFDAITPSGTGLGASVVSYKRMLPQRKLALGDYVGDYVSDELSTSWCVFQKEKSLYLRRRAFQDRPLELIWEDAATGPGGIMQFIRTEGRITGFHLRNVRLNSEDFVKLPAGEHPQPLPYSCPK